MTKLKPLSRSLLALAALVVMMTAGCEAWSSDPAGGGGGGIGNPGEGGGFLWKPAGENSGRLVVLLPPQYRGRVATAFVADSGGNVMETGIFSGVANGNRPHYRFTKQGGAYGNNIYAVAELNEGISVHWSIPVGSQRTTY